MLEAQPANNPGNQKSFVTAFGEKELRPFPPVIERSEISLTPII